MPQLILGLRKIATFCDCPKLKKKNGIPYSPLLVGTSGSIGIPLSSKK